MSQKRRDEKLAGLASLPVEQLSEVGWQRIERRLFAGGAIRPTEAAASTAQPRTPGRRMLAGVAVAAVAIAVAAVALLVWPGGERAHRGAAAPAHQAEPAIRAPSRIVTEGSPSAVSVGDVALEVAARSALLVDDDRWGALLVVLERGEVTCRVAPRAGRPPVVVHAGDARIEVVGTAFAVTRIGDSARVVVYEGVVEVVQAGRRHRVAAGETWPGTGEAPPPARAPTRPEQTRPEQTRREPTRPEQTKPAHTRREPTRPEQTKPGHTRREPTRRESTRPERPRSSAPSKPPGAAAPPPDKARYERAASLESSDPSGAIAIYDDLARGGGAWAANALFAQARLEVELGHLERARRLLESYITRYPRGANAEDARQLLRRVR
jgi:outer membrane biosynthesis protein TonB